MLSMPGGARAAVLGHTISALGKDATAAAWNPACLGLLRKHEFSLSHAEMPLSVRHETLIAAFPREYLGAFAVRGEILAGGAFKDSRTVDELESAPEASDLLAGAAYGGAIVPDHVYVGAGASVFQSRLADSQARGVAGDFFLLLSGGSFRFALGAKNIGPAISYGSAQEALPSALVLGLGQDFPGKRTFCWGLGAARYLGQPIEATLAAEYGFLNMALRAGYTASLDTATFDALAGLRLGTGFREQRYAVDYAWEHGPSDLGGTHYLSIAATFKEIIPKNAEDYFQIGLKHFRKGNYRRAIDECENALRVNPNLWKAHTLISESYSNMRKAAGMELALIYTSNMRGEIAARAEGKGAMGGMARQATAIRQLRSQNPSHLVLDGGNLITAKTQPIKIEYMLKAVSMMGYSALGIGASELARGLEKVCFPAKGLDLAYTATNIELNDMPAIVRHRMMDAGKYKVGLFSVLGQTLEQPGTGGTKILRLLSELGEQLHEAGKADLRIVTADLSMEEIGAVIKQFPEIDVILTNSNATVFARPMVIGNTLVLSPGAGGRHVGCLTLLFNESRELLSYQHRMIRLSQEVAPDQQIEDLLNQLLIQTELEQTGDSLRLKRGIPSGMVLFVSDRTGTKNVYLRFLKSNVEFRLTSPPENHFAPIYSPVNSKVAYVREWSDSLGATYRDLWTMELPGAKKKAITHRERVFAAAWHPGTGLLYFCSDSMGNSEIYRTGPEGESRMNLTQTADADETEIIFSPAGKEMVYVSNRDQKQQLYISGVDGSNSLRMTDEDCNHGSPAYSADGKYLAYLSDKLGFGGKKDLAVQNLETNGIKYLTQNANVRSFLWLPEGEKILYEAGVNLTDLNVVRLSDTYAEKLLPTDSIKDYSERNPRLVWFENEPWVLYEKAWENKTILNRVRLDGNDDMGCVVENPNNTLR